MRRQGRLQGGVRPAVVAAIGGLVACFGALFPITASATSASAQTPSSVQLTPEGLKPGSIKHVWLIILENKSYDATFTGLNDNSYLWKTLPAQGVLLKNYYGTGHFSEDNYLSLVSGQAPSEDVQEDCSATDDLINTNSGIETAGPLDAAHPNYGQLDSHGGANAPLGSNGCSYPTAVPTLFNQFNAAGVSWKGYAQDLGGEQNYVQEPFSPFQAETVPNREDAACAAAGTSANDPNTDPTDLEKPTGDVASFTGAQNTNVGGTDYIDQYVAKHFPFGWFESLSGQVNASGPNTPALNEPSSDLRGEGTGTPTNCDSAHLANLDSPTDGLVHDLQSVQTTPEFSWISPDNCSDAHDAVCKGNNLSGAFNPDGTPDYEVGTPYAFDPTTVPPKNFTGGLYASDLFLEYYIPLIEQSPAFKDGGLIDVTFDEGFAPFTYSGNSFNNDAISGPGVPTFGQPGTAAPGADSVYGAYDIVADAAGENINGHNVATEPTGPNSTLSTNASGDQLDPGPGNNADIDRPPVCTSTAPLTPANCVPGIVEGGAGSSPGSRTDSAATGGPTTSYITDPSILADDTGRIVTGTKIPANSFVGAVIDQGPEFPQSNTGSATQGMFQLVDQAGNPVEPTGPVSGLTLGGENEPGFVTSGETVDPLFDAIDPTPGGGDTGSVLISPFIHPGTSTTTYYNHYSWLRTMEDLFDVSAGNSHTPIAGGAGSISGGLDGRGHIGYAAQDGLRPFGPDVFNNPTGHEPGHHFGMRTVEAGVPLAGLIVLGGGFLWMRHRHRRRLIPT
jgi:hypothetical protein